MIKTFFHPESHETINVIFGLTAARRVEWD